VRNEIKQALLVTADRHGQELAGCDRLLDLVLGLVKPWQGRPLDPEGHPHDLLIAALLSRSTSTFWATLELARMGFGDQAAMLNRSLFEDMVDIHWVRAEPEAALERYEQHHEHGRMLYAEQIQKYPDLLPVVDLPGFDPADRERLNGIFGRYGAKSWTTLNLRQRIEAIEDQWEGDLDRRLLHFFRDIPHRENNQALHVTAQGLTSLVRAHDHEGVTLKVGPGGEMLDRALFGAFWTFSQTAGLILDHFEFRVDDAQRNEVFSLKHFAGGSAATTRDVGRNDPCPCGSGKKFKRCHGS
jgi:hypothetical protein